MEKLNYFLLIWQSYLGKKKNLSAYNAIIFNTESFYRDRSYLIPKILGSKIGGFTGDACGASVVLVETTMLFIHAVLL